MLGCDGTLVEDAFELGRLFELAPEVVELEGRAYGVGLVKALHPSCDGILPFGLRVKGTSVAEDVT